MVSGRYCDLYLWYLAYVLRVFLKRRYTEGVFELTDCHAEELLPYKDILFFPIEQICGGFSSSDGLYAFCNDDCLCCLVYIYDTNIPIPSRWFEIFRATVFVIYIKFMLIYNFKCIFYKQKYVFPYYLIKFAPVNTIIIKIHRCLNFFSYICRNSLNQHSRD